MALMDYENQMFLDAFHDDGLLIVAKGLGLERIFTNFLKLYSDAENLVLVLNTSHHEEDYFMEQLQQTGTKPMPKVITSDYTGNDRFKLYMEGGVLFITSRILVMDLLTDKIPVDLITGILVYKAHKIIESCQEAFILRLFRQKNKKGFIKAFSASPQAFTAGFCHVERVMKSLFVKHLFLWPRFQADVVSYFNKHQVDVVELHLQLTAPMVACQTALLDLIDACLKELKRGNPSMDTDELTVENAIGFDFEKLIRSQLDPVWHQLSAKTKQLVTDVKTLRLILEYLTQYDCVNFYNLVNSIRTNEKTFGTNSGWLFLDAADSLFMHARERVYRIQAQNKKKKTENSSKENKEPELEECPKWAVLKEVLDEIEEDNTKGTPGMEGPGRVLVAASDDRTCNQLREILCEGGQNMLRRMFEKTIALKTSTASREENKYPGKGKGRGKTSDRPAPGLTLTQMVARADVDTKDQSTNGQSVKGNGLTDRPGDSTGKPDPSSSDAYYGVIKSPVTVLHPLFGSNDPFSLIRTLEELQPRYVVLYDAQMTFVRQLEVYRASHPGQPLRVYFLMYTGSSEEQRYLTVLRKEKEAFEYLIREKANMVIPEERDGKLDDDPRLARDQAPANATVNTRSGGLQMSSTVQHKVIVDMREFRSELPSLIHRRGIDIEPVTIEVGDYILTPDICVERKSVSDLIGSLGNGRLYNQCVAMCRYYKRPILLIEFDPNKAFSLQGKGTMSSDINSQETMSKLTLLTLTFPRLRILWCQSPYATAELFEEIKGGRAQPDASAAMAITSENEMDVAAGKFSHGPQEMLLKMPGLSSKNVFRIMNKVEDFAELVTLSVAQLTGILSNEIHAKQLHSFLHCSQQTMEAALPVGSKPNTGTANKLQGKSFKRKR